MPIYEFYCPHCHTVFNYLSRRIRTDAVPECPRCAKPLQRKPSTFAVSRNQPEPKNAAAPGDGGAGADGAGPDPFAGMDESKMESVMESLASEAESLDENDPRAAAAMMRRLFGATGMPVGGGMEEALKRMESGEDPEKIEEEMGDILEKDPFGAEATSKASSLKRRLRIPPNVDPELREL